MESEGSLSCSYKPTNDPYPEPDQSPSYLSKSHHNIILSPTSWSP
jgi:hypothetical protein